MYLLVCDLLFIKGTPPEALIRPGRNGGRDLKCLFMSSSISKTFDREAGRQFTAFRRTVLMALIILVLTVGVNVIMNLAKTEAQRHVPTGPKAPQAEAAENPGWPGTRLETWLPLLTFTGGLCCAIFLLRSLRKITDWRASWRRQMADAEDDWQKRTTNLESARLEAEVSTQRKEQTCQELEQRLSELTKGNAQLQEKLDQRKLSELMLTQQQKELVRSKDVLEMHVQARTQELQKLQHRYELILNSAGDGICGLDIEGRTTFVNPAAAKITGWEIEHLIGRHEHEILGAKGAEKNGNGHDAMIEDRIFRRRDGSRFPAEVVKTPIWENGREVGAVLVFKDITERKRVEETLAQKASELARSNAELEQFAFVASHDLQEPLRKIQSFGDRLKLKCETVELGDARDYLERMQSAAGRMQTLINDLLAFSRVIRSSEPFVQVDLAAVTKEVLSDLEVRIEKTCATLEIGELPKVEADPTQMRQLMQNLISNALKFQPPDRKPIIKIQAEQTKKGSGVLQFWQVSVQDNGIGFDEKYLEKVFAVFQRLHGRSEYEGTGVGLAVCRRILDRHGGTITARSKPGEGAIFVFTLPLNQPANSIS
jgi:PAS domain S-box-containing protein